MTYFTYGDGTGKWHSQTIDSFAEKDTDALKHIIKDCQEAIKANPANPKTSQYADEIHYACMELNNRGEK